MEESGRPDAGIICACIGIALGLFSWVAPAFAAALLAPVSVALAIVGLAYRRWIYGWCGVFCGGVGVVGVLMHFGQLQK